MATINSYVCVAILCFVNLLNYMDRFTIAGVLDEIKKYFEINDATAGLLQTVFICSYMVFAPVFGFLGDRYSRKIIIIFGVLFWSSVTLLSSFVQPHHTGLFFLFRGLVGIGEASYSTVAPTIIADLFVGKKRSTMIALFYFAIPVGSGLGYIVGSQMASIFGSWHWALRFTPTFGLLAVVGFLFITEPERGAMESERYQPPVQDEQEPSSTGFRSTLASLQRDAAYLVSVPTYVLTTLGFTCVSFSIGALSWWAPTFMKLAIKDSTTERQAPFCHVATQITYSPFFLQHQLHLWRHCLRGRHPRRSHGVTLFTILSPKVPHCRLVHLCDRRLYQYSLCLSHHFHCQEPPNHCLDQHLSGHHLSLHQLVSDGGHFAVRHCAQPAVIRSSAANFDRPYPW